MKHNKAGDFELALDSDCSVIQSSSSDNGGDNDSDSDSASSNTKVPKELDAKYLGAQAATLVMISVMAYV